MNKIYDDTKNNVFCINTRLLYEQLEVKKRYADWIKIRVKAYGFIEGIDYVKSKKAPDKGRGGDVKSVYYMSTIDMAIALVEREFNSKRNKKPDKNILSELYRIKNNTNNENVKIITVSEKRDEIIFYDMLSKITGLTFLKQYPIDNWKYRLDFYLKGNIIIEYDEEQHSYNSNIESDRERMEYCIKWLRDNENVDDISVIRVKKGEELEGIHNIVVELSKRGLLK